MDDLVIHFTTEGGDCFMTIERAMEILDPKHRENYESIAVVEEAMQIGRSALALCANEKVYVYVCYLENRNDLAKENGVISGLQVFSELYDAYSWLCKEYDWAIENSYLTYDDFISPSMIKRDETIIKMFWKYLNNYDVSFDIVVKRKLIDNPVHKDLEVSKW